MAFLRLTVCVAVSLCLHFLLLQIGMSRQVALVDTVQQRGVSLVTRSSKQFLFPPTDLLAPKPVAVESELDPGLSPKITEKKPAITGPARNVDRRKLTNKEVPVPVAPEKLKQDFDATVPDVDEVVETDAKVNDEPVVAQAFFPASSAETVVSSPEKQELMAGSAKEPAKSVRISQPVVPKFTQAFPRYETNPDPEYPKNARKKGQQGIVQLEVLVLSSGQVGEIKLSKSSGYKSLDRASLKAVKFWQFKPAQSFGDAVESRVIIPVAFVLDN